VAFRVWSKPPLLFCAPQDECGVSNDQPGADLLAIASWLICFQIAKVRCAGVVVDA
jgi:hypothetical protein